MKLYIWNQPYAVAYGGSIIYAVADTEDEARAQAMKAGVSEYGYDPKPLSGEPFFTLGEPDRVIECPCAEIYHWSE